MLVYQIHQRGVNRQILVSVMLHSLQRWRIVISVGVKLVHYAYCLEVFVR